jgi:hypothetical protein
VEQAIHLVAKEVAKKYLMILGFPPYAIKEEQRVRIKGKTYQVDVVGEFGTHKVAVECGETEQSKLDALKEKFDLVFHLRYEDIIRQFAKVVENYYKIKTFINYKKNVVEELLNIERDMANLFFEGFPIPIELVFGNEDGTDKD